MTASNRSEHAPESRAAAAAAYTGMLLWALMVPHHPAHTTCMHAAFVHCIRNAPCTMHAAWLHSCIQHTYSMLHASGAEVSLLTLLQVEAATAQPRKFAAQCPLPILLARLMLGEFGTNSSSMMSERRGESLAMPCRSVQPCAVAPAPTFPGCVPGVSEHAASLALQQLPGFLMRC